MDLNKIEKVKEYLKSYEKLIRQIKRSEIKIQEMRLHKMNPSVVNDGIPHSSGQKDLSDYAALLDQEERQCKEYKARSIRKCIEITNQIEKLSDEDEKDILTYRYIKLMKWEEIAVKMHFSWQYTHKIHARALKNFKIGD